MTVASTTSNLRTRNGTSMMNGHGSSDSMEHPPGNGSDVGRKHRGNSVPNHSNSFTRGNRRSSLTGAADGAVMGGGVPNPYGYTTTTNEKSRSRRAERNNNNNNNNSSNNNNNNNTKSSIEGGGEGPIISGRKVPPRTGSSDSTGRPRPVGIVRQGSARLLQLNQDSGHGKSLHKKVPADVPPPKKQPTLQHVPRRNGTKKQQQPIQQQQQQQHISHRVSTSSSSDDSSSEASSIISAEEEEEEISMTFGDDDDTTSLPVSGSETEEEEEEEEIEDSEGSIPLLSAMDEINDIHQVDADAKKEALVESLVWFSHHTPRTVLEDLVSHEIEIWQAERGVDMTILEEGSEETDDSMKNRSSANQLSFSGRSEEEKSVEESAVSDLSEEEGHEFYDGNFSESILKLQHGQSNTDVMIKLPKMIEREGALLFVDITGFTKLSTMLDCESLSKVINSYFDMIVNEVVSHGGDILKFAGDAFFAEWKVNDYEDVNAEGATSNPLSNLNASLSTIQDMSGFNNEEDIPRLATCVLAACKCAAAIVEKFSDYQVSSAIPTAMPIENGVRQEAMLNVHCGVGAGHFVGLHVGDYKEDPDEEGVELRREFLVLGDPIDQVR
mgnify:CR=1 FL=1